MVLRRGWVPRRVGEGAPGKAALAVLGWIWEVRTLAPEETGGREWGWSGGTWPGPRAGEFSEEVSGPRGVHVRGGVP